MEEKILYRISNPAAYDNKDRYMRLSKTNIDFLSWLADNDILSEEVEYEPIDTIPNVAEF